MFETNSASDSSFAGQGITRPETGSRSYVRNPWGLCAIPEWLCRQALSANQISGAPTTPASFMTSFSRTLSANPFAAARSSKS